MFRCAVCGHDKCEVDRGFNATVFRCAKCKAAHIKGVALAKKLERYINGERRKP